MQNFPFLDTEWDQIRDISGRIVNASFANDSVLKASLFIELTDALQCLSVEYGEHPVLLETEADFTCDIAVRVQLYERAIRLAVANGLPTASIRISLAGTLLSHRRDARRARIELDACKTEVELGSDDDIQLQWRRLNNRCQGKTLGRQGGWQINGGN